MQISDRLTDFDVAAKAPGGVLKLGQLLMKPGPIVRDGTITTGVFDQTPRELLELQKAIKFSSPQQLASLFRQRESRTNKK